MQTRLEQIAAAFPLHYQRIVEIVCEQRGSNDLERWTTGAADSGGPGAELCGAFIWHNTVEGREYWRALSRGAGWDA